MDLNILYSAAIAGQADAIAKLEKIADGLDSDWTILHHESRDGNTERVRFIVTEFVHKLFLVKHDNLNHTVLHLAAYYGHTEVVEVLLDAARRLLPYTSADDHPHNREITSFQAFVRQPTAEMNTALHLAVINGHVVIAKLLIEADPSDRHIQNGKGETPVYLAARLKHYDVVKTICGTCTAPILLDGPLGTALHAALYCLEDGKRDECRDVIKILMDAAKRSSDSNAFEALFNKTEAFGHTILEMAVILNHTDVVKMILAEDPGYQLRRVSKITGLTSLIEIAADEGSNDVVEVLCKTFEAGRTNQGLYALLVAIRRRDKEFALDLLGRNKRVVTYTDDYWWTPLHHAIQNEFDSMLDPIIQAQEDSGYQRDEESMMIPPLLLAVQAGNTSTVIQLLKLLPNSWKEFSKECSLQMLAASHKKEIIQYTLKNCPKEYIDKIVNGRDEYGNTPLHILFAEGCFVPELIHHEKVDNKAKNERRWTAFDMLYFYEHVVADQVRMKEALNDNRTNPRWKFWRRGSKGESNFEDCIVPQHRRLEKDKKFEMAKKKVIADERQRKKEELDGYRKRTNTQIIVTALITTVTFTVGFTMPGGYYQSGEVDQGLAILSKKTIFKVFMIADALALALSTTSLFIYFISSMSEDPKLVSKLDVASTLLNIVSVIAMMSTFIAGTYLVLSLSAGLAITVSIICCTFFLSIIILLVKMIYHHYKKQKIY